MVSAATRQQREAVVQIEMTLRMVFSVKNQDQSRRLKRRHQTFHRKCELPGK
jgi:hypothetical protein